MRDRVDFAFAIPNPGQGQEGVGQMSEHRVHEVAPHAEALRRKSTVST